MLVMMFMNIQKKIEIFGQLDKECPSDIEYPKMLSSEDDNRLQNLIDQNLAAIEFTQRGVPEKLKKIKKRADKVQILQKTENERRTMMRNQSSATVPRPSFKGQQISFMNEPTTNEEALSSYRQVISSLYSYLRDQKEALTSLQKDQMLQMAERAVI